VHSLKVATLGNFRICHFGYAQFATFGNFKIFWQFSKLLILETSEIAKNGKSQSCQKWQLLGMLIIANNTFITYLEPGSVKLAIKEVLASVPTS